MSIQRGYKDVLASRAIEPLFYNAPHPEWSDVVPSPYQNAAVEYRLSRRHAIIGDPPGLGKTAEALLYGNAIEAGKTLVVCPAALRLNWEREIKMWSTIENVLTYPVQKSKDGVSLVHDFVIISYSLLSNPAIVNALMAGRWDHLILDECHALKDPKGNTRTEVICAPNRLPQVCGNISLLSGTLLPNQPIECYNAVRLADWDAIDRMSLEDFREYYYDEGKGFVRKKVEKQDSNGNTYEVFDLVYSNSVRNVPVNLPDLQYRLRKNLMVRRKKSDVMPQLPPKRWHIVPMERDARVKKALAHPGWATAEALHELDPEAFDRGIPVDGEIGTALRQLGEAKAPQAAAYIKELLDSGVRKVLVAAWHRNTPEDEGVANTGLSVLHYLRRELEPYGLVYMDGSTSSKRKQAAVDAFQEDPETRVILGQLLTIGEGWTLTKAQDAVLAEFFWVPGKNDQLLDRLHRRGQEGSYVTGHVPAVIGSIDERVLGTAIWKDGNIHQALDAEI